jgi:hypothetical protein
VTSGLGTLKPLFPPLRISNSGENRWDGTTRRVFALWIFSSSQKTGLASENCEMGPPARNKDADIISPHGRGHSRASRGAEARDCRNPGTESCVFACLQTPRFGNRRPPKTRAAIEDDHERIEVHVDSACNFGKISGLLLVLKAGTPVSYGVSPDSDGEFNIVFIIEALE